MNTLYSKSFQFTFFQFLDEDSVCQTVSFKQTTRCNLDFCYNVGEDGDIHLTTSKVCTMTQEAKLISTAIAIFLAIVLGGLILICISKIRLYRLERAEFKRFENEEKFATEMNPLYKAANIEYKNPLHSE